MVGSTPVAHAAALYERDFVEWTRQQAAALRAAQHGSVDAAVALDHEHLAREIERLGESRARRPTGGEAEPGDPA